MLSEKRIRRFKILIVSFLCLKKLKKPKKSINKKATKKHRDSFYD